MRHKSITTRGSTLPYPVGRRRAAYRVPLLGLTFAQRGGCTGFRYRSTVLLVSLRWARKRVGRCRRRGHSTTGDAAPQCRAPWLQFAPWQGPTVECDSGGADASPSGDAEDTGPSAASWGSSENVTYLWLLGSSSRRVTRAHPAAYVAAAVLLGLPSWSPCCAKASRRSESRVSTSRG